MLNRNGQAAILFGLSDDRLASRVLEYARASRRRLRIGPGDVEPGALLYRCVPMMASYFGSKLDDEELEVVVRLSSVPIDRTVAEMSSRIMRASTYSFISPDNSLFRDPAYGNPAALLLDRFAHVAGVARVTEDGDPCDPVAARISMMSSEVLGGPVVAWSPGIGMPETAGSSMKERDLKGYLVSLYALDDRQLAAELLENARDAREQNHTPDDGSPESLLYWHVVPTMAAIFAAQLRPGEGDRIIKNHDERELFDILSESTFSAASDVASGRTLSERALAFDIRQRNSTVLLLDRVAAATIVDRGGSGDLVGRKIYDLCREQGRDPSFIWSPEMIVPAHDRSRNLQPDALPRPTPKIAGQTAVGVVNRMEGRDFSR